MHQGKPAGAFHFIFSLTASAKYIQSISLKKKKKRLPGGGKRDEMSAEVNGRSDAAGRENGPRLEEIDTVQFKREGLRPEETYGGGVRQVLPGGRAGEVSPPPLAP